MSGFLPGLAQLAAAGLVKAGLAKRPEKTAFQTAAAPATERYHQCPDTHREN